MANTLLEKQTSERQSMLVVNWNCQCQVSVSSTRQSVKLMRQWSTDDMYVNKPSGRMSEMSGLLITVEAMISFLFKASLAIHIHRQRLTIHPSAVMHIKEEEKSNPPMLTMIQPGVWSVSDFVFLALAYEGRWPVLSLAISSSHWQCTVSVLILAELAKRSLTKLPHSLGWQSTLTTRLQCMQQQRTSDKFNRVSVR